jgi:SanA protein
MQKSVRCLGCLTLAGLSVVGLLVGWRVWLTWSQQSVIYHSLNDVPPRRVAIVLGAGVVGGLPTPALADRIEAAAELYHAGKVRKLLMTGDNSVITYNEPGVMKEYAQRLGVPADDIVLDYAGRRTYDSCYRAQAIFGLSDALVVTQPFHLPRATYLCSRLGIDAIGYEAAKRYFSPYTRTQWHLRETLATAAAWWDIHIARPVPILGDPIPIPD